MDNGTIITDGGRFFDSGGAEADASNENYTKYFWPATQNNELRMTFTHLDLYNGYSNYDDRLYVYDATTNQLLLNLQGTPSEASMQTDPPTAQGKGLKIVFQNETGYGGTASGWDANIESVDVTYANTTYPMDWDVAGTSKVFDLDYSTNGGVTWKRIMSNYYSPTGHYEWPVPNNATTQALIKVTDTENGVVVDVSDADFTIEAAAARLTSPNVGEAWFAGTEHEVTWVSNFMTASTVTLSYSLDGGESWTALATTDNDGSYTWLLPSTSSTTARVKVETANEEDISDADFTILPHITVTSPNGGEALDGCASTTITWQAGGTSGTYGIDLSMDGGSTWENLTESATGSSWNWSVITNETTSEAKIRVRDMADASKEDASDAAFDLLKTEDVVMLSPNGGETWFTGEVRQLNYIKDAGVGSVDLAYSVDNGQNWINIATSQTDGAYGWTVPNTPAAAALLRVQDHNVSCRTDLTDAPFAIISEVDINVPNGGEIYQATVMPAAFGGVYLMDNGTVTTDGGRFYDSGGPTGDASNTNYTKYFWPATQENELRLTFTRLDLYNGYSNYDDRLYVYDATTNELLLNLQGAPSEASMQTDPPTAQGQGLKIVFQNETGYGGTASGWDANIESIAPTGDSTHPVDWQVAGTSKEFHLDYSTNGGASWKRIVSNYYSPTGHYDWPVPNDASSQALVRVMDTENGEVVDVSDLAFQIQAGTPQISILHPNDAATVHIGSVEEITWQGQFLTSPYVAIDYSADNGATWTVITGSTLNDGTYEWLVPDNETTLALIRIRDAVNNGIQDVSDIGFTIAPPIALQTQNTLAADYRSCTYTNIDWFAGGTSGTYAISYSVDAGETWLPIEANYTNAAGFISYNWLVPNTPTTQALVKVEDVNAPSKVDLSDNLFTISPTVELTSFTYGGLATAGETAAITWNDTLTSNFWDLAYSLDLGQTWSTITNNHYSLSGQYNWTVPFSTSSFALVRVEDANNACKSAQSVLPFETTAYAPTIEVLSPNGGEGYAGCSTVTITWEDTSENDVFNLEYRPTPGAQWIPIVSNLSSPDRTYDWSLPNEPMPQATIRVRQGDNSNNYDISDYHFSTTSGVELAIESSTGSFEACVGDELVLTASGAEGYVWSGSGATSSDLTVTTSGTYAVTGTTGGCSGTATAVVTVAPAPQPPVILFDGPSVVCDGESVAMSVSAATGEVYWPEIGIGSSSVVVTEAGTYHATLTLGGCTASSAPATVEILPVPTLLGAVSNSPVLTGATLTLQATVTPTAAAIAWNGPGNFTATTATATVTPATAAMAGMYSVSATLQGCASDTLYLPVTINDSPFENGVLAGSVFTPSGFPLAGATITAEAAASGAQTTAATDASGVYMLGLVQGNSYWLSGAKPSDDPADNGITTLDILLAQGHILGTGPGLDPWAILAADVNASGSISTLDLLLMQQRILQLSSNYPGADDWHILPSATTFPDPEDPFDAFPEALVPALAATTAIDFTAVKRGDVNGSWAPMGGMPWAESHLPLTPHLMSNLEGTAFTVHLLPEAFASLRGLQLTLGWPADWTLTNWAFSHPAMQTNAELHAMGRFPVQFTSPAGEPLTFEPGTPLLSLTFTSTQPASLGSLFLAQDAVPGEACAGDWGVQTPWLAEGTLSIETATEAPTVLAFPNPTGNGTFQLTGLNSRLNTLQITDATGREVASHWRSLEGGTAAEVRLEGAAGWYVIRGTMESGAFTTRILVQ
ncbi:T9SS type A sorting domain-containing protein [bacterium]|nr:T9SS type A sorting domain-containing protein [bacterium]